MGGHDVLWHLRCSEHCVLSISSYLLLLSLRYLQHGLGASIRMWKNEFSHLYSVSSKAITNGEPHARKCMRPVYAAPESETVCIFVCIYGTEHGSDKRWWDRTGEIRDEFFFCVGYRVCELRDGRQGKRRHKETCTKKITRTTASVGVRLVRVRLGQDVLDGLVDCGQLVRRREEATERGGPRKPTAVDRIRILVRDLDAELLLDRHHHLHRVEAVEAEVVGEVGRALDLGPLATKKKQKKLLLPREREERTFDASLTLSKPCSRLMIRPSTSAFSSPPPAEYHRTAAARRSGDAAADVIRRGAEGEDAGARAAVTRRPAVEKAARRGAAVAAARAAERATARRNMLGRAEKAREGRAG